MISLTLHTAVAATVLSSLAANVAGAQLAPRCVENSPERRGEVGCSIVARKALPDSLREPLYWHLDRFDSRERARLAVGPASVLFEAAGTAWLMTVGSATSDHRGGHHVAELGPLRLPPAAKYSMQALSALFTPGMYTIVHHHSGVEVIYVIDGEGCFETPRQGIRVRGGDTLSIPAGTLHRAAALGSSPRHVLGAIIHDATLAPTVPMEQGMAEQLVACS